MADFHDTFPLVTVEDSSTGETKTTSEWNLFELLEGNFTCDCNREILFGNDDADEGVCMGCKRYWVVGVEPMPEGCKLSDFNVGYPTRTTPSGILMA